MEDSLLIGRYSTGRKRDRQAQIEFLRSFLAPLAKGTNRMESMHVYACVSEIY